MGFWKSKVLPKIKKVFDISSKKTAAAAEASSKSFDDSKEAINKEMEEKKTELQPKVVEVYEASTTEIKNLVKEPKEAGLKKHSAAVNKFLEELVKIEFPGSKQVSEATSKYGAVLVSGPVLFILEKVSTFVVVGEERAVEVAAETTTIEAEQSSSKEEIVVEEEKKEKAKAEVAAPAAEEAAEQPNA